MSWLTLGLVGVALVFWLSVFAVFFREGGESFLDYLRGKLEPLPDDLATWRVVNPEAQSTALGAQATIEEQRLLLVNGQRLIRRTRYRDRTTGLIVRTEPEET